MINNLSYSQRESSRSDPNKIELNEYYQWRDERHVSFRRGSALIFSQNRNQQMDKMDRALQFLGYQPQWAELSRIDETLSKSN